MKIAMQKEVNGISFQQALEEFIKYGRMIGAINEFERANLLERQREGIQIAKREGKFKGRKATDIPDFNKHYEPYMRREVTKVQLAKELQITRPTLDKLHQEKCMKDKESIRTWVSAHAFAKYYGLNRSGVTSCAKGDTASVVGRQIRYYEGSINNIKTKLTIDAGEQADCSIPFRDTHYNISAVLT